MIEYGGRPGDGAVAGITVVGADDVIGRLAWRDHAVVTAEAAAHDFRMVNARHG